MTTWEIDQPRDLELPGDVRELRLRVVGGDVAVTSTSGPARVEVTAVSGEPLRVAHDAGVLTVGYDDLTWRSFLRGPGGVGRWRADRSVSLVVAVPATCRVQLAVVSATAVVSGITEPAHVRTVSGTVTLDGIGGAIEAQTISGDIEAVGLDGDLEFQTVSGDLTVAGGQARTVSAKSVSGDVTLSLVLADRGSVDVKTVSGDVVLRVQGSVGATVDVSSMSGELTSVFSELVPEQRHLPRLRGTLGDGSGRVKVKTVSGDVGLVTTEPASA